MSETPSQPLRLGMAGLDTSHCLAFLQILHDPSFRYHIPGARVVGAVAGGSSLFSFSQERVAGYTREVQEKYGVRVYDRISDLAGQVDAWLLESVDGRQHWEQFQEMAQGQPVFIDKPLATSTQDARQIFRLAAETGTPVLSCSSLRFAAGLSASRPSETGKKLFSCEAFGPAPLLDDYPGLFWYGVHGVEILLAQMGCGCRQVACLRSENMDLVSGWWEDGRVGIFKGLRGGPYQFGCLNHTEQGALLSIAGDDPPYYYNMLQAVLHFFQTGVPPVEPQETFEIMAFLEAAERSAGQGGAQITLEQW